METSGPHADLSLNTAVVRSFLVRFLADEVRNAGFARGVVGLSGGVDSAVTAYLACEALGRENLTAIMMPYRSSSRESLLDAQLVVDALRIPSVTVDITPMVDAYLESQHVEDRVRAGNVMARQRMIVLYDFSARERALVLGTSNKTELLLGYGTLFGDMASAVNPLGDLYKTQVWQLAAAIGVPGRIVEKKPSADLWSGQTDEGELGFTYADADRLLFAMIDERHTDTELAAMGFGDVFIRNVRQAVQKSQFKRRPPVVAKVSHRTVNVDFRYARDWGL
ncbi:MAG TPA: NAD+ synthase [Bacteroidota bacterium]|nr:NAD+ synthase [Bacteroidota bacterium]